MSDDVTPATEAGRMLLATALGQDNLDNYAITILAIEAEARAGSFERGTLTADYIAKQRAEALRGAAERVRALPLYDPADRITAMNGSVREPRTMADAAEAFRVRALAAILDGAPEAAGGGLSQRDAAALLHEARIGCSGTRCDPTGDDLTLWHYEPADRLRVALTERKP